VVARLDEPMFDLNQTVTAQMLREREIAIHGSKQYVIDTIMKMRAECGYDDFCFLGWFELGGFAPQETERFVRRQIALRWIRTGSPKVSTRDLGDAVEVEVRDNEIRIPAEIKDKLFQPFFTTKPTGEGTGLGLSISYDIVTQEHGGTITADSQPGDFTEFTVRLPRTPYATMAEAAS
jgi:hypothetical protein